MASDQQPPAAPSSTPASFNDGWFDALVCRNCDAPLATPFCAHCGQKKAQRLGWRDIGKESWERWRLFELQPLKTLWRLLSQPGTVAREYALGRRARHMHPLKLLVVMVALLLLMVANNNYFRHFALPAGAAPDPALLRMVEMVQSWANWSFSTGIIAIFIAAAAVFRHRHGVNPVELAVLAVYCQIVIIAAMLVSMLPTLLWNSPAFITAYKLYVGDWLMSLVKLGIVAVAFVQFFRLEWPRLLLALVIYLAAARLLVQAYAWLIGRIVHWQLAG